MEVQDGNMPQNITVNDPELRILPLYTVLLHKKRFLQMKHFYGSGLFQDHSALPHRTRRVTEWFDEW